MWWLALWIGLYLMMIEESHCARFGFWGISRLFCFGVV